MNKRKTSCDAEIRMFPNPKHRKLADNGEGSANGNGFVNFDDDSIVSERTAKLNGAVEPVANGSSNGFHNGKSSDASENGVDELLHGIDFDSSDEMDTSEPSPILDLTTWKRCIVDSCSRDGRTHDLLISGYEDINKNENQKTDVTNGMRMVCRLQHFWSQCRIEAGDTISILAIWNAKLQSYCVTNADGLVIVRPDFLVSGTTVVGGLFCMRKAVLQDRFKGIDAGMKIVG